MPTSAESPAPPQPTPTPPLSAQIGVRADLPVSNPIDLALRYRLTPTRAAETKPFAGEAQVGDQRRFTVVQLTGGVLAMRLRRASSRSARRSRRRASTRTSTKTMRSTCPAEAAQSAADNFEASVWPTVTAAFGMPAIPGIDGDPRIIVLQSDLGGGAGGYFSSDDEYPKSVRPLSNEAEIVYLIVRFGPVAIRSTSCSHMSFST